jgi:basic membrane lipoprotein Med (substrate-binding protein (PBP1-ABC) superfamily)
LEEATFLLGELAARMAPNGAACAVGGMEIPSVKSTFLAFQAGAARVRKDYPVTFSYLGNWDDVGAARTATLALIDRGCRFVLQNADAAGPGVFQAAAERGVFAFGSNRAQHEVAPAAVLASAVIDIPTAFVAIAREVEDGTFKSRVIEEHMKDGAIAVVYNPALVTKIPSDVHNLIEQTEAAIRDGTLKVPTAEF